jgi:dolichol-phosphate mannosyltransferase
MSKTIPYRKALYVDCGLYQDTVFYEAQRPMDVDKERGFDLQRFRMAVDVLILFTDLGYKVAFLLSIGMIASSILIAIYAVFIFTTKQPVSGWTSMMLFLSLCGAGIFAVLAIIIKYLDILMGLIFKKRIYTVESIEKLTR